MRIKDYYVSPDIHLLDSRIDGYLLSASDMQPEASITEFMDDGIINM